MAMTNDPKGFIRVYRQLLNWEWYSDPNTLKLFIHCLLKANWKEKQWHGITIKPGQFFTSLPNLAAESGLTIQQVRTALAHLEKTGELTGNSTDTSTGKRILRGRIITISNWDKFQGDNSEPNRQNVDDSTGNQQATNRQPNRQSTATKERKEYKEGKEGKNNKYTREEEITQEELEAGGWGFE